MTMKTTKVVLEEVSAEGPWSWIALNDDDEIVVDSDGYETETDARQGWNEFLRTVSRPIEFVSRPHDGEPKLDDAGASEEE